MLKALKKYLLSLQREELILMTNSDTLEPADLLLIGLPFMNDAWAKYPDDREHMKQAFKASEGYKQALTTTTNGKEE